MMLTAATIAMLFANEVWAVYGIGIGAEEAYPEHWIVKREETSASSESPVTSAHPSARTHQHSSIVPISTDMPIVRISSDPPSVPHPTLITASSSPTTFATSVPHITATSNPTSATGSAGELELGVKVGIGLVSGFIGVALIMFLVEACYLRKRRREKALQRAVEEVERGERSLTKGSEEVIVLESRVSIVFDDVSEMDDDEDHERGRARHGMSLPRREY